jgi:thiol-disulfide isomerase/thioredoxin
MKPYNLLLLISILYFQISCTNNNPSKEKAITQSVADAELNRFISSDLKALTKDFMTWYNYTYHNVRLSQDFVGLDIDSVNISKDAFLNKLIKGNALAFKTKVWQGKPVYQLFSNTSNDESISTTSKQMAMSELMHYNWEGKELPDFNFTDLNGRTYNKSSTKGKTVVIKCWFIHCATCVKEFPESNQLVDQNRGRDDVLFISLAMDNKRDLQKFLVTKEFKYAVVPGMEGYMVDKLNVSEYPTHILVGKDGKIVKVVNSLADLKPFLDTM